MNNPNVRALHDLGQRIWLDNIDSRLLNTGRLTRLIDELCVTGLTSNPTIFERAMVGNASYGQSLRNLRAEGLSSEEALFEVEVRDVLLAADLFRPMHDASDALDGWVSLEVSPLLANDAAGTAKAATRLHARAARPNIFVKIPGTAECISAIEQSIFDGVPINVTLLFSSEHYDLASQAYLRAIERRVQAGLDPLVACVASLFVSRWDVAVMNNVSPSLQNCLGIAIAMRTYNVYCEMLASERWQKLARAGAKPQRLLWASTGTKDPGAPDTLYVSALAAPATINTMPEETLLAFADHGRIGMKLPVDGGDAEEVVAAFERAGVDVRALAVRLQRDGVLAFASSWRALLAEADSITP